MTERHAPAHRAAGSTPASQRVLATPKEADRLPWYKRGKTLLLGAGAIAGAALAVLGLWDRIFPADQSDIARIDSVDLVGQTSFKEFAGEQLGVEFPLDPISGDAAAAASVALRVSMPDPVGPGIESELAPEDVTPESAEPRPPADDPATTQPETEPPDVGETDPPESDEPETDPPETSGPPETPSEPPDTEAPAHVLEAFESMLPQTYLQSMAAAPVLDAWDFEPGELQKSYVLGVQPTDEHGEELPAEEVASRVAEVLVDVESTTDEEGDLDPAGWTVAVNLTLEGLQGVPLLLTWSLEGVDVPDDWAAERVSYRVVAGTPRDAGSAEIWIPHLTTAGEYNVVVKLKSASDLSATLASGPPLSILIPE